MSPVSRGRDGRRRQKRARRSAAPRRLVAATSCDCDACASLESTGFDDPDDPAPDSPPDAASDQAVPIYQIRVTLRDIVPPIWRRLELTADTPLGELDEILQLAFNWHGIRSPGLPGPPESVVVLGQIAAAPGATLRYDCGEDWPLEVHVERVVRRDQTVAYPRCTGGERAAPPQHCGGIHGYQKLINDIDERRPTYYARLQWWREHGNGVAIEPEDFAVEHVNDGLSQRFPGDR